MSHVDIPQARVSPALLMGAASPLWGYFAATAAGGVAFWWMTRWTRPVNLEAFFAPASPQALPVPTSDAAEIVACAPEVEAPPEPEPLEAAAERVADPAPEPEAVESNVPELRVRARKSSAVGGEPEA